ncbi:MAG: sodium:solute symporter family protein [Candidatus Bathyarchaeia archaeon]
MDIRQAVVLGCVVAYIALIFIIGGVGKFVRLKEKTIAEYFRPSKFAPFWAMWFAMGANMHTAFCIPGSMGFYYTHGVAFTVHWVWTVGTAMIFMYLVGPRMHLLSAKYGHVTLSEMIGDFYKSKGLAAFVALFVSAANIAYFTANTIGPATLLSFGTGGLIPFDWAVWLVVLIVMAYTIPFGFRSVFYTDILQGAVMLLATWGSAFFILSMFGWNTGALFSKVAEISPKHLTIPGGVGMATPAWWFTWPFFAITIHWGIQPRNYQYYQTAKSAEDVRKMCLWIPIYLSAIYVPVVILGLGTKALMPEPPKVGAWTGPDAAFPTIMAQYAPALLWGILIAGSIAAGQSTMDSDLVAHSGMLINDVYKAFLKRDASQTHYLVAGRVLVLVLGIVAGIISINAARLPIVTMLVGVSGTFVMVLLPTVLGAILPMGGFRITKWGAFLSILIGGIVGFVTTFPVQLGLPRYLLNPYGFHSAFWAFIATWIVAIVVSLVTPPPPRDSIERFHVFLDRELKALYPPAKAKA